MIKTLFWLCFISLATLSIYTYLYKVDQVQRWQVRAWENTVKSQQAIIDTGKVRAGPVKYPKWWRQSPWKIASDVWSSNIWNMLGAMAGIISLIGAFCQGRKV